MSQGDDSLNRQDEQGRKGKEKIYWWRAETWLMKGVGQGQKEKVCAAAREMIPRLHQPNPLPSHGTCFSTKKRLLWISAKRRIIQHVVPSEAVFPIFCQRMRWSWDQLERYNCGCSLLGICSTRRNMLMFQLLSNGLFRHCSLLVLLQDFALFSSSCLSH